MRDIPRVQWIVDDVRELMHWIPFGTMAMMLLVMKVRWGEDIILQAATLIGLR